MEKGWVKLHRRISENHFLMHDDKAFIVFTKMLLYVGKEKGQWSGGRNQLAELLIINSSTLYKVLKRLEGEQLISIDSNSRYSVITICNWHKYQSVGNKQNSPMVAGREQHGNSTVTAQGHSNKKEKKKKKKNIPLDFKKNSSEEIGNGKGYAKAKEVVEQIRARAIGVM